MANQCFFSRCREVDVLCGDDNQILLHAQLDKATCLRGEDRHAAQSTEQLQAVYRHFIRVVLRNHRVVVGIASFDKTAHHAVAFQCEHSVAFVELNSHHALFLRQQVLHQRSRLLGQDKGGTFVTFGGQCLAAHQLMTV